jgi:NAD(P)-dependent dehydrogenase (short-subunit alcohol dehydrogenase family)
VNDNDYAVTEALGEHAMDTFENKVAVITGAGGGIGAALAIEAAAKGMFVVLADVNLADAQSVARTIGSAKGLAVQVDVANADSVDELAELATDRFGGTDLLCNNAGVVPGGRHRRIWEFTQEDWHWAFDVNVMGVANGIRSFVPRMIARGTPAHVLNTASVSGFISGSGSAVYGATKHAVVRMTEALHAGLVESDLPIGVTMLCPGLVNTRIFEAERSRPSHLVSASGTPEELEALESIATLGADPVDVAASAFEAITAKQFYAFTSANFDDEIRQRFQDILARRNPGFADFTSVAKRDVLAKEAGDTGT